MSIGIPGTAPVTKPTILCTHSLLSRKYLGVVRIDLRPIKVDLNASFAIRMAEDILLMKILRNTCLFFAYYHNRTVGGVSDGIRVRRTAQTCNS